MNNLREKESQTNCRMYIRTRLLRCQTTIGQETLDKHGLLGSLDRDAYLQAVSQGPSTSNCFSSCFYYDVRIKLVKIVHWAKIMSYFKIGEKSHKMFLKNWEKIQWRSSLLTFNRNVDFNDCASCN